MIKSKRMNTINKYIHEEEVIDPFHIEESGYTNLEIWIESKNQNSKLLRKKYMFNKWGKIKQIERLDDSWTAYPPLVFDDKYEPPKNNFSHKETFIWKGNLYLEKIQIQHMNTNELIEHHYEYLNGKLSKVIEGDCSKSYFYNEESQLIEFNTKSYVQPLKSLITIKELMLNSQGKIRAKMTSHIVEENSGQYSSIEKFIYNEIGQIIKSITEFKEDGKIIIEETEFTYLNRESNKLKSINTNNSSKRKFTFNYDKKCILNSIVAENSRGEYAKTIYKRY